MYNNLPNLFDEPAYININEIRWAFAKNIIANFTGIKSCIDVGCGPGWFSNKLIESGFEVLGLDGRQELVDMAKVRVPKGHFEKSDITFLTSNHKIKPGDLTFCFGLLYHLENPFAAIRNLHDITGKYLFIETQVAPGEESNFTLVSEGRNSTQGLNYHALIPSRNALIKMLYVSGFKYIYRYTSSLSHEDFIDTPKRSHRREIFLATKGIKISLVDFCLEPEPITPKIDYSRIEV